MKLGKKLLSLLTVLCLTLSLFPTMALADGDVSVEGPPNRETSVTVGSATLNSNTPYLVKDKTAAQQTITSVEESKGYIQFTSNGQITLNNYAGSSEINATSDLTINLVGKNTITTPGANSIYSTGALTITSSSKGSLTAENLTSGSVQTTIYSTSDITITGNATVTAKINGTAQAINSHSENGTITIADHATVTATNTNNTTTTTTENGIAILAGNSTNSTNSSGGTIEVKDSATLTAQGHGKALACRSFSATGTVKASTDYQPKTPVDYVADNLGSYKYVNVTPAVVKYNVWVGGTQVTSVNKDNVLGDGTVTYTPATTTEAQKLTLNGANISASGTTKGIISTSGALDIELIGENKITTDSNSINSSGELTITSTKNGSLTMSSKNNMSTLYATANITISGSAVVNATINGGAQAIHSNPSSGTGSITITGNAKVTAKNTRTLSGQTSASKEDAHSVALLTGSYPTSDSSNITGTITVSESASLVAQGSTQALMCATFTYPTGKAKVSTNYSGTNSAAYTLGSENNSTKTDTSAATNLATYKCVEVAPVEEYDVWVGGTQINSSNASDVLGNSSGVSYEPTTKTLTLTNATITGAPSRKYTSTITDACGIYAKHDLKVALVGSSTINGTPTEQLYGSYGIFVSGRLTFTSDSNGSLTVSGGKSNNSGNAWVPGVYASGITVKNCNVTAMGGTASDSYPVAYAMSKAPTLVGAKVAKVNTATSEPDTTVETYDPSHISRYKYLKIEQDANDKSVAAPVIAPEGGYFTSDPHVTISCPTDGATIYYTTDGTPPTASSTNYTNTPQITLNTTGKTTIKAIAVKGNNKKSDVVTAEFTKRAAGEEVTKVALDVAVDTHNMTTKVGNTEKLTATVQYKKETTSGVTVTWLSDNPDVATVAQDGTITAKSVGKARVTAAVVENGVTYSDFCDVIVEARPSSSHHSSSSTTYYDVNAAVSGEGGSVAASTKRASRGTTVTVTATAASGYQVAQVSAVDKDGKTVSLTDKGDGVYTFVMPASKVDVTARFAQVQKPEEKDPYGDVSKDSYYYDAVKWAAETGVTTGVGDGLFAPEWVCTRGQIVTFLWRASGSPAPKATELPFTDVAADAYYAQAVLWAVEKGITNGTSETTFSPDQTCTRAHAVAFLYRMSGSPAAAGSTFSDVAADAYYSTAVAWAVEKGITNGTSGTTFSPDDTCTRGQIVTFLYRLAQTK